MNDESISGVSNVEYQVRIDFRNPRNPRLNLFCDKRSHFRRRHGSEEYPQSLFSADDADQFVHHAIRGDEDQEDDLDGPEMRPDDFREQLLIAGDKAARLAPEIVEAFEVMNGF